MLSMPSELGASVLITGIAALTLIIIICAPLLPAILIYKIFPDTKIGLRGVFSNLTISATGAFAAYFIVLLTVHPFAQQLYDTVIAQPVWTIKVHLEYYDKSRNKIDQPFAPSKPDIALQPDIYSIVGDSLTMSIPLRNREFPFIKVTIPEWGAGELDLDKLNDEKKLSVDNYHKTVKTDAPLVVKEWRGDPKYNIK